MHGHVTNIELDTLENDDFRRVLFTGPNTQLVLMTLAPGEDIGRETHDGHDQFIRIESGVGVVELDGEKSEVVDGSSVVIPAGVEHNLTNTSDDEPLRLYTLYSPPEHPDGTVHRTKKEAEAAERH
jgi:mannose-6-phosphate isomerase-like protein (cupin superfamily)